MKESECKPRMESKSPENMPPGQAEWFHALFEEHRAALHRYAMHLSRDADDAQDLVQESFAIACLQLDQLRDRSAFPQWVRAILRNTYRNHCRKAAQSRQVLEELANGDWRHASAPRPEPPDEEQIERVLRSAQSLPVKYREILVLRFIEEMPYQKIAEALDLPESTVSRRIAYARQSLIKAYLEAENMNENNEQKDGELNEKMGELLPIHRAAALGAVNEVERLIANGVDINARDEILGATPLFWAVLQGRKEVAQLLLNKGADINAADADLGFTPLHVAALVADRDISEILLKYGADATIKDKSGKYTPSWLAFSRISGAIGQTEEIAGKLRGYGARVGYAARENYMNFAAFSQRDAGIDEPSPGGSFPGLYVAIATNDKRMVEHFIDGCGVDANMRTLAGFPATPMHFAVLAGQPEMIDLLLSKGGKMTTEDIPLDPIHWAAAMNKVEMLEFLLERGANLHPVGEKNGPLHLAASSGHIAAAQYLLGRGADPNGRGNLGNTPLQAAISSGNVEMAEFLLEHGADMHMPGAFGAEALHIACSSGIDFERQRAMVDYLIARAADVNERIPENPYCEFGSTPLSAAAGYAFGASMMNHLISRGADIQSRSESGRTILHHVALHQAMAMRSVIDFIVAHGVPVDAQDDFGESPLHVAARKGVRKTAEYLIQIGADAKLRDKKGRTPEMAARDAGEMAMAKWLRSIG